MPRGAWPWTGSGLGQQRLTMKRLLPGQPGVPCGEAACDAFSTWWRRQTRVKGQSPVWRIIMLLGKVERGGAPGGRVAGRCGPAASAGPCRPYSSVDISSHGVAMLELASYESLHPPPLPRLPPPLLLCLRSPNNYLIATKPRAPSPRTVDAATPRAHTPQSLAQMPRLPSHHRRACVDPRRPSEDPASPCVEPRKTLCRACWRPRG
mmetsp:Transcript_42553/g.108923  ORF Transcript_42553/g.108923 Transcript_42553/m.108923 type:complete len:207 (+) Transcript_42553:1198-1818(+)